MKRHSKKSAFVLTSGLGEQIIDQSKDFDKDFADQVADFLRHKDFNQNDYNQDAK